MAGNEPVIESVLRENRSFAPPEAFSSTAHIPSMAAYRALCAEAEADPEAFWGRIARENLDWFRPFDRVLDGEVPFTTWFKGGELNVSHNCLDRHLGTWRRNKAALIWEGEPGDKRVLTYHELHRQVCRVANLMKSLGIERGDRIGLYMPLVPELAIAMLACTRIGATHSIIFGGFSADAIRDRMNDAQAKLIFTADGGYRRGGTVALKSTVDAALEGCPSVEHVVVLKRTAQAVEMRAGRDLWWDEALSGMSVDCPAESLDAEHPLFILYTSGTTGKPKGVLHTTGGYLTHVAWTSKIVFDLKDTDTYWCTADIGWVTGHSYLVYGPLANGATAVMYEGTPNHPSPDRVWDMVERYGVTILYTAPTLIRSMIKWGDEWPARHNLSSLRLLGTVGEPINPEAWMWYKDKIGGGRCPIVDTWWQTETGGILITPLPGATPTKPGSATFPLPGVQPAIVDDQGNELLGNDVRGNLCLKPGWPGQMRTVFGDHQRFVDTYFKRFPGMYFTGDGAWRDQDGYYWITGRVDDILIVSGHNIGTAEVEGAIGAHPSVAEAAVVGFPHDIKGQAIYAFVTLRTGQTPSDTVKKEINLKVRDILGPHASPEKIQFTEGLPKTRSGKIMRRILRKIAENELDNLGDISTLADPSVVESLVKGRV